LNDRDCVLNLRMNFEQRRTSVAIVLSG